MSPIVSRKILCPCLRSQNGGTYTLWATISKTGFERQERLMYIFISQLKQTLCYWLIHGNITDDKSMKRGEGKLSIPAPRTSWRTITNLWTAARREQIFKCLKERFSAKHAIRARLLCARRQDEGISRMKIQEL
ncbi:MAG: hypothetical protein N2110_00125 [Flavobacteriales bacterium]|nr:hypothetical protein [Flavobacteriales bacterium]